MVGWGVLGTAQIAKLCVIPAILKSENSYLVAVASRSFGRAQSLAAGFGQGRPVEGYDTLLENPEIEAVYIPLPNHLHAYWTQRALTAGKHVLVEKPFSMNAAEALAMSETAQVHNRLLMEAFMYRFHPRLQQIRQLVERKKLGQVRLMRSSFTFPVIRDGSNERLFLPEMGGGVLWDVGCYGVSLARWILGEEPISATAQAVYGETGVDLTFVGVLGFASGALAVIESSFQVALQQTFSVFGDQGAVELPHNAYIPWEKNVYFSLREAGKESGQKIEVPGVDEYQLMVEHFSDAVLGRTELAFPPDESVLQMTALDALAAAARRRHTVWL